MVDCRHSGAEDLLSVFSAALLSSSLWDHMVLSPHAHLQANANPVSIITQKVGIRDGYLLVHVTSIPRTHRDGLMCLLCEVD